MDPQSSTVIANLSNQNGHVFGVNMIACDIDKDYISDYILNTAESDFWCSTNDSWLPVALPFNIQTRRLKWEKK